MAPAIPYIMMTGVELLSGGVRERRADGKQAEKSPFDAFGGPPQLKRVR